MKPAAPALSGYRILRVMALFDLPVLTKPERKRATKFREFLLDEGFTMMQFSCYIRFTAGKEQTETLTRRIGAHVPTPAKSKSFGSPTSNIRTSAAFAGAARNPARAAPTN